VALFVVSRALFLDRDVPRYSISQIQPIDEFYYTIPAFNLFHHGSLAYQVVPYIPTDGAPLNLLQSVLTSLTLLVFGNNYYGMRMASVLAGIVIFVLLFLILRREVASGADGAKGWVIQATPLLCLVYLVSDFSFNVTARVADPSISRMLAMVLVLFVVSVWPQRGSPSMWRAFALGFLGTAAFVYVYAYNPFIFPAVVVTLIVEALPWGWRGIARQVAAGAVGAGVAILSFAGVVYATYGESLLDVYRVNIAPFTGRLSIGHLISVLPANFISIFSTNIFRFDLPILLAFLLALPVFAHRVFKERSSIGILTASLLIFLGLQTLVAPDTGYRRLVVLDPLVVLVIAMAVPNIQQFATTLRSNRLFAIATVLYLLLAARGLFGVLHRQSGILGSRFVVLSAVCVLVLVIALGALMLSRRRNAILVVAAISAVTLPGAALSTQHLFLDATFHYRDAMVAAAPILDGQITAGEFSYAFRLYNTSEPFLPVNPSWYSASVRSQYNSDLGRLLADGTSSRTVSLPKSTRLLGLGMHEYATFFIGAERVPYLVVYVRTQG
jgi:hypothetical protein